MGFHLSCYLFPLTEHVASDSHACETEREIWSGVYEQDEFDARPPDTGFHLISSYRVGATLMNELRALTSYLLQQAQKQMRYRLVETPLYCVISV